MPEYIEREATIKVLRGKAIAKYPASFYVGLFAASKEVDDIPSADVAPVRHGRWEKESSLKPKCSVCGEYHLYAWSDHRNCNYCPNCGARMDLHEGEAHDT